MIKKLTSFASSLNAANRMGKAPIFLKHRAKNIGRIIKRNPKKTIAAGLAGAVGLLILIVNMLLLTKIQNKNIRNELNTKSKNKIIMPVKNWYSS
jgi:hypothetical protein